MGSGIGIAFLLLIFFLVTSTLQPREADLGMSLPRPYPREVEPVVAHAHIKVAEDSAIFFNDELVDAGKTTGKTIVALWDRLFQTKKTLKATRDLPLVIIDAHGSVTQQRFVDVLNCVAGVGIDEGCQRYRGKMHG